jgi:Bacterial Ig-like domain
MICWTSCLNNIFAIRQLRSGTWLAILFLAFFLSGCAGFGGYGRLNEPVAHAMAGSTLHLVSPVAAPAETTGAIFEFQLRRDGRDLPVVQSGPESSWDWQPRDPGNYQVRTVVRDAGGKVVNSSSWSGVYAIYLPLKVVVPVTDVPAPQALGKVVLPWQATAEGGAGELQYEFQLRSVGGSTRITQAGPSPKWNWHPAEPGIYQVRTMVSDRTGHAAISDWSTPYQITPALQMNTLVRRPTGAQAVGSEILWSADIVGGVGERQYEFQLRDDRERVRTIQTGPSPSWLWTPAESGTYQIRVAASDARNNTVLSHWSEPVSIAPPLACKALVSDRSAPQMAGTTVIWRADASGGVGERSYQYQLRRDDGTTEVVQSGASPVWSWHPAAGRYQVQVQVTDAAGNRIGSDWSAPYEVAPRLELENLTAGLDSPQVVKTAVSWQASATGGVGERSYEFQLRTDERDVRKVQAGSAATWQWNPEKAGRYQVRVLVRDVLGNSVAGDWSAPYRIEPRLEIKALVSDRSAPQMAGTTVIWRADATGGVGERSYEFEIVPAQGEPVTVGKGTSPEWNWKPANPGIYKVRVVASDAAGHRVESPWSSRYEIRPALEVKSWSVDPTAQWKVDAKIVWTASATGGIDQYAWNFYLLHEGVEQLVSQAGTVPRLDWVPRQSGAYQFRVEVVDSLGNVASSDWSAAHEVAPHLDLQGLSVSQPFPQKVRSEIRWKAETFGGTGEKTFKFMLRTEDGAESVAQSGSAPEWVWVPDLPGRYQVMVVVRDSAGEVVAGSWSESYEVIPPLIAILPFENLSAVSAPLAELRQAFIDRLRNQGLNVMDEAELEAFMARFRLRYTGGIDRSTSLAFQEAGVDGVLISSLTLYRDSEPPLFGLASRLVATGVDPVIIWADRFSLAGNQAPGLLGLGLVHEVGVLRDRALQHLTASLSTKLASGSEMARGADRTFRPRLRFRASDFKGGEQRRIAILPFLNQSERRFAGDLVGLDFLEALRRTGDVTVLEPGVLRKELLNLRAILPRGASLDTADILFSRLNVDLLLSGEVRIFDQDAAGGAPRAYFTVQVIDRKGLQVVWSSQSSNSGNDGVWFFDHGRVETVGELISRMTGEVVRLLAVP